MNGRRIIERRTRIFLGCEGESEQGYGAFLQRLADEKKLHVHLVPINLQPAGDPSALVKKAVRNYAREEKKGGFVGKLILLDRDKLRELPDKGQHTLNLLTQEGFTAIWQRPDHEGFLLRHFAGHETDKPPRGQSMTALYSVWPEYHKNMPAIDLSKTLTLPHVQRAAGVVSELKVLLELIGL